MSERTTSQWAQTTAGVWIVQGLVGPVVTGVVGVLLTLALTQPDTVGWRGVLAVGLAVAIVGFLTLSVVSRRFRPLVWGSVWKALKWLAGLRLSTQARRASLRQQGYDARDAEVRDERRHSPRPMWRVTHREGDPYIYLDNSGYSVRDVVVRADAEMFVFAGGAHEGFVKGELGDNSPGVSKGTQIAGEPTLAGLKQGVTFELSWVDQHGDAQPTTGDTEMPTSVTLPAAPLKPVVRPTWQVGRPNPPSKSRDIYVLVNGAAGCIVRDVRIDADPSMFTFTLTRELGDLEGMGALRFAGRPTDGGRLHGVNFSITYKDANGDEQTDWLPVEFGMSN